MHNERGRSKAFTLIELLMVFFVMSLLAGLLAMMATAGLRGFAKAKEDVELIEQVTLAFDLIRRDLLSAVYKDPVTGTAITGISLIGTDATAGGLDNDRLNFYAEISPDTVGRTEVTSINYKLNGLQWVRGASDTAAGGSLVPAANLDAVATFEPLVSNAVAFNAEYLPNATASSYQASWNTSTAGDLPRAVRLKLTIRNPRGKDRTFTQTVTLNLQ